MEDISDALLPVGVKGGHDLGFLEKIDRSAGYIRRALVLEEVLQQ